MRAAGIAALLMLGAPMLAPGAAAQPTSPAPVPDAPSRMRLDVETLQPRVITSATPAVTVTGKVTNIGDRRIDDVEIQLRRGESLRTDQELRDSRNQPTNAARSPFVDVVAKLEPGQSAPVRLTVPANGGNESLRIEAPGVYPLLVNVNGTPEYGRPARLAALSVLLPVLSVPGAARPPNTGSPSRLTMLWPLMDTEPRRLPVAGAVLADDELAASLSVGGRLFGLVNAVETAAAANSALLGSLCFAVDPDLLQTVAAMAGGYQVRTTGGQTVDGRGASAAATWLTRLRALTRGQCVIPVPFSDADLAALSRSGAVDLEQVALSGAAIVEEVLAPVKPVTGIVWPIAGTLDARTLSDLAAAGPTTVLGDPARLQDAQGAAPYAIAGSPATNPVRALPIDGLVSAALAGGSTGPDAVSGATTPADDRSVSAQNGLATLIYRAAFAEGDDRADTMLVAPPRRWSAPAGELSVLLQTVGTLFDAGLATPAPLPQAVLATQRGSARGLDYTPQDSASEIPTAVTAEVVRINTMSRDLHGAMEDDATAGDRVDPNTLLDPLRYGLLRATSTAWRGRGEAARQAVGEVATQLDALRGQVTVANPGRPLSLASGNSPIPVLITNSMPVAVLVRITLGETPGLRPEPIADVLVPARSSVNKYLPAEVIRAGRFHLDVSLSTPGGTPLGSTARLELNSSSYGSITVAVTGTAAGILVLLVGLRIYRRIRAAREGTGK